ncbi:guanine deaminase [Xenococcus sp. PCC 7305]|uniref:guanine deaminase n=1 Tax=Xenococcus sp. PCC 7305 TaxID=102125 RepID=UPI0002AC8EE3|nr:guanine deaminase [Xenococcus sp. PCC 7305]ELS05378.1 guanine deaminase [Xenococcus sp. PCC 7305]
MSPKIIRGSFLDFVDDPFFQSESDSVRYLPDGLLVIEDGKIAAFGAYKTLSAKYADAEVISYGDKLITPGLIDLHVHYPQTEMIAAYGEQLLQWLDKYTFPTEAKFKDPEYARTIAAFFLEQLLHNGTTSAVVLTTIFPESVEVLFEEARDRQMRIIAGQVLMTRHAPEFLINDAKTAYAQTREQIQQWHGLDRLLYAITPRFAITSTPEELTLAGKLKAEFPDVYVHTHLAENVQEVKFTAELFPESTDYLDVYEQFGLVGDRSIFAHCIQLDDSAFQRLSAAGSAIAFCPTSNLFLGSGLFRLDQAKSTEYPIKVGLATDVGAGTSFSQLQTMGDAYKVMQLQGKSLSAFQAFYLATLGAAKALSLEDKIGSFEVGKEADFVVWDLQATPLMKLRNPQAQSENLEELAEKTFAMMILGDERTVRATYVAGELVYENSNV